MNTLRLILGDQLSTSITSLADYNHNHDVVLMCEVWDEATYVKHHKKKVAFIFSAMRHFAKALQSSGYKVSYTTLDDPANTGSLRGEVERALQQHGCQRVVVTSPGEYRVLADIQSWASDLGVAVDICPDERFMCNTSEFNAWAAGRKQLRMEFFYREMRKKHRILMDGDAPLGGQWNYDSENRKPPKDGLFIPSPYIGKVDAITQDVLTLVGQRFADHFGDLLPFYFAVTRADALQVLQQFVAERLCLFGDYQDAMVQGEPWMYHSHISFYLNCGLLLPMECVQAAVQAYQQGHVPLNAAEGFVRQIMGWREYVRGLYWLKMPAYAHQNYLNATRPLPSLYWTANTHMNCLRQCVSETKQNAYAHHIQRLMVLGNFALLAGIKPSDVNEWYLIVYADAYEWVEMPNVTGMILYADGGLLASKPYAAGGSYIDKMSDYCKSCTYKVALKNGEGACPFNYLYWDFLARNRAKLQANPRVGMMYNTYDKMDEQKKAAIGHDSTVFFRKLAEGSIV